MYLKSIRAQGFKSFADKTEFVIPKGITGIVGPNGSGKSNVVDAIRWVLGEQSLKALRGTNNMSDVIFSGSKSRPASTRAVVALTFDNEDHYLNSNFSELEIKRVVYKSGENEYYINNTKTRLKDILDLFIDSGAGKESFNIISQGAVTDIINSKASERRVIFESAAGVLKYKKRKEESLRKLERTEENLDRVKLVIDELKNTVEPLIEQSRKAREYLNFKGELENIEIALIASDIEKINSEYLISKQTLNDLTKSQTNLDLSSNTDYSKLEKMKLESIKLDEDIQKSSEMLIKINQDLAELSSQKQLSMERKKYEVDNIKLQNNIINLKEEELTINKNLEVIKSEITILESEVDIKTKKNNDIITILSDISQKKKNLEQIYSSDYREYMNLKNKADILEENINNDSKLPYGIKSILNNPRLKSVHNILGKLLDTSQTYATAIETVLGFNSNVIVVENEVGAKECINYLKDNKLGRATFFPLNIIKERFVDQDTINKIQGFKGYIDVASNLVNYDSKYSGVIKNQLGNVLVVDTIDSLNALGRFINYKYRIVTIDGEILHSGGSISGGTAKSTSGIINQKYELEELLKKINQTEVELKDNKNSLTNLEEKSNITVEQKQQLTTELHDLIEQLNRKNITCSDLKCQYQNKVDEIKATNDVKDNKVDESLNKILEDFYKKTSEKEIAERVLNKLKQDKLHMSTDISELENINRKTNSEYNKILNDIKTIEIKLGKMDVTLDNLLINLNENYNMTFEKAKAEYSLELEENIARSKVNNLKKNIRELGEVNTGSIQEYERLNTRYEFLLSQKTDLETSITNLLSIISEMDTIMEEKFIETFNKIKIEFNIVFKKLFKGGIGILELSNPDDILTTGIDIIAEPPGKKISSIGLLSGGEKTLTAIALLFAILNVKPVPFCILDEIEAALDESNVDTFGTYLKEKSQFIVITHKKRTMEYADSLYGITMQESGVSKLVSVNLEKI